MSRPVEPTCVKSEENMKSIVQVNQRIEFVFTRILAYCFKNAYVSFSKDACGSKRSRHLLLLKHWNSEKVDFVGNHVKVYCKIFCANVN